MNKYFGKLGWWDITYLIILFILLYWCSSCTYTEGLVQDEYITIYDKDWNVKYYGKIRKE